MKTLFIGNYLSRFRGTINPSEKLIYSLRENHNVSVRAASFRKNVIVRSIEKVLASFFWRYEVGLIDFFSGISFYFHGVGVLVMKMRCKKTILTLHGASLVDRYVSHPWFFKLILKNSDVITTPSQNLKAFFSDKGYPIIYLPNSLDLEFFKFIEHKELPKRIVWIRAFHSLYNPLLCIKGLEKILEKIPDVSLDMYGPDLGSLTECKNYVSEKNLEAAINFRGPVQNSKIPKLLSQYDLYINTTSFESFGMGVLEAAASGIPIATTSVGELPLIWSKDEVSFFEKDSASDLAALLYRICSGEIPLGEKASLARRKAENYDSQLIIKKWKDIIVT